MKLEGRFRIPAPRAEVFARLNDPYFFASCLEGVSDLQEIDPDNYKATLETKIAYINFRFDVAVRLAERTAERVVVVLDGTPRGMVGRLSSTAVANLVDAEAGRETDIVYEMEVALAGRLGSLGQPVMKSKAQEMERGFVRKASAAFVAEEQAAPPQAGAASASAPMDGPRARPGAWRINAARWADALAARLRGTRVEADLSAGAGAVLPAAEQRLPGQETAPRVSHGSAVRTRLDFELLRPSSLAEAMAMLDSEDPAVRPISGGTALMLMMKAGVFRPTVLVDLSAIPDFGTTIEATTAGGLRIGGQMSLAQIGRSEEVMRLAPVVARTMPRISNVRVRNAARLGGCLAHGDPHMDLPPILSSLRAQVDIVGPAGQRSIPLESLYAGYYQTVLERGEIISGVVLPDPSGWKSVYRKMTVRTHEDWPALGVAISLSLDGPTICDARVVISAATEKVTRVLEVERRLVGAQDSVTLRQDAADIAADAVTTLGDAQGSAAYKRELVRVEVRRALEELFSEDIV